MYVRRVCVAGRRAQASARVSTSALPRAVPSSSPSPSSSSPPSLTERAGALLHSELKAEGVAVRARASVRVCG